MTKHTKADSPNKTCTEPGCDRALRARGLCGSHYNRAYPSPNRHAKKLVPCANCGKEVLKGTGGGRVYGSVCSDECRAALVTYYRSSPKSELPTNHWARWYGKASAWPRYGWKSCTYCATPYASKSSASRHCSNACMWRTYKGVTRTAEQLAARVMQCVRCDTSFQSPHLGRIHCTDLCRDLAANERGATLHHGWIRPAVRQAIYERDGHTCWLCNEAIDHGDDPRYGNWSASLDHVIPRSKGGTHDESNLRTAHRWCNAVRSDSGADSIWELA